MPNLKLAVRTLLKTPFVTAVAVISLALGIGANAAIYSLFDQTLLRGLPVQEPGRLVNLEAPGPKPGSTSCGQAGSCQEVFSYLMFKDLERVQDVFEGIAAHVGFGVNLAYQGHTRSGQGTLVSGAYFSLLGVRPGMGRLFTPDDDKTIGGHFVTVLSHAYWERHLGANPNVLNTSITVNGHPMTVIGVAPRGFTGTTLGAEPDVYVPITMRGEMIPGWKGFDNRRTYWAYLFARLKPGISIEQAQTAINGPYHAIINDVEAPLQKGMSDQTLARFRAKQVILKDGWRGQSSVHREASTPLILLFSITGIVLLIACANIANLLLARSATRTMEMAVRLSIGASRRHLLAQLLAESVLLALMGAIVSLMVAYWTLAGIQAMLPEEATAWLQFTLDRRIAGFAGALAILTGLLFGIFPALHSTRPDLVSALKGTAGQPSGAKAAARFRTSLVTAQIALSMALLMCAGLFVKSLINVSRVNLGLQLDRVITFSISPDLNGYDVPRMRALYERIEQEAGALPGVASVSAGMVPLLSGSNWGNSVSVEGFAAGPDTDVDSRFNEVGPGYFRTVGIPLMSGREFTAADAIGAPKVAIVNEAFANKFNLGRNAVGKHMSRDSGRNAKLDIEIVGLAQNAKYSEVRDDVPPVFFTPYRQDERLGGMNFYVRTAADPVQTLRVVPAAIARLDPNLPVEQLKTMPQQVRENVFLDRMISTLSACFAALATLLAAIGLYGVLAYTIAQRTREIGLRMALGADPGRVRRMVLGQVGRMTIVGGIVGIAAAVALGRFAQKLLFQLKGYDPVVIVVSATLLVLVAFGAGFIPAQRAATLDPMRALRYE
jgi:putative ABC transport system permease protein